MKTHALYHELFASSPDGILLIDPETQRVIEFNDAACRQLGYTREEFASLGIPDFEAAQTPEQILARVQQVQRQGLAEFDTLNRTKTGEVRHAHVWAKTLEFDGRVVFYAIVRDITERKQAEEALRHSHDLLDRTGHMAKVGGWELDLETQTLRWTTEVYRIHEVDPAVTPSVAEAIQFYAPEAQPVIAAAVQAALDAGTPFDLELPLVTAHGRRVWVRALGTAERREGKTIRLDGAFQDITERRQLEAQYRQAQRMESVGLLASGIAHDFNNLLTVINGMTEFVLEQIGQDHPAQADVLEIARAGERATLLTRQLLAFSHQQILAPQVLNLNTVVADIKSLLRRLLREDITMTVAAAADVGHVKADPGQLEQVITNLAVNAQDAMPRGGRLVIETQNVTLDDGFIRQHGMIAPPGSYVMLAMSDSGVGMDEATRARVFDPFFTTKGPGKGTGLGLATVFGIVKQGDGCLWVESEVGQGTTFKIYLPRVTEPVSVDRPAPTVASRTGTETILLVEDSAGLRRLAARVLAPAGYTILEAATGEEALRLAAQHDGPVHLLLSDVVMPGMSGRELAERLMPTRPELKVLYMSGYTSDTIVRHGVSEAKMAFLSKPFSAAALLRSVREALDA